LGRAGYKETTVIRIKMENSSLLPTSVRRAGRKKKTICLTATKCTLGRGRLEKEESAKRKMRGPEAAGQRGQPIFSQEGVKSKNEEKTSTLLLDGGVDSIFEKEEEEGSPKRGLHQKFS